MVRKAIVASLVLGMCAGALANNLKARASASEKGSFLVWPRVVVRLDSTGETVLQDTFITLANDYTTSVSVHLFFVSETCTRFDNEPTLTPGEAAYWSSAFGLPKGVGPFTNLGIGVHEDPNDLSSDILVRGYVFGFAQDPNGNPVKFNHLYGGATIVDYVNLDVNEYNAYAFAALPGNEAVPSGTVVGPKGLITLNGTLYDSGYAYLLLDFFASGSQPFSYGSHTILNDTLLTLMILDQDVRTETAFPFYTRAHFDVWNQNEMPFSGGEYCFIKWDERLLSEAPLPNPFLLNVLGTNKGQARITGVASELCFDPNVIDGDGAHSLLGVSTKLLTFDDPTLSTSSTNLFGAGQMPAFIYWDGNTVPQEKNTSRDLSDAARPKVTRTPNAAPSTH